jgi:formylglycine-generating enzyme required for sulfatase activity
MTRRRKMVFALLAATVGGLGFLGALAAADVYVHRKFAAMGGVNIWGYRGPTVGRKQAGERRVVVLGESTAFGFGVHWNAAFPAALERLLNQPQGGVVPARVSVVNLAYNVEGAHSYRYTLADYEYLNYDVAVFYTGYPDLSYLNNFASSNQNVYRHGSALFRLTGYFPMLPLVMREKAMAIRYGGRLDDAYQGRATVFRPNFAQRTIASALAAAAEVGQRLDQSIAETSSREVPDGRPDLVDPMTIGCGTYTGYCRELFLAVKFALDRGARVVVVTQPYVNDNHKEQQFLMAEYLRKRFPDRARLHFAIPGTSINLADPALTLDGMHLSAAGNAVLAQNLVEAVRDALATSVGRPDPERPVPRAVAPALIPPPQVSSAALNSAPAPSPGPGQSWKSPVDGKLMTWIPPGTFQMGSPSSEPGRDVGETTHRVTIDSGFWMDTTAVTNAEYRRFVEAQTAWSIARLSSLTYQGKYLRNWRGTRPPESETEHPVTAVSWYAARAYCTWAGKRLPTEAEREYATRAGTTSAYWWGDAFDGTRANANRRGTEPVGQTPRVNPWGLADMSGNVWEWTSSWYHPYPYRADDGREGAETDADGRRVLRGGAWVITPEYLRSADRFRYNPRIVSDYVGFRCVRSGP